MNKGYNTSPEHIAKRDIARHMRDSKIPIGSDGNYDVWNYSVNLLCTKENRRLNKLAIKEYKK